MNRFTRGLIAGSIIGAALGMMIPAKSDAKVKKKTYKNSMQFVKRASGIVGDIIDML